MSARVALYALPGALRSSPAATLLLETAEDWLGTKRHEPERHDVLPSGWSRDAIDAITIDARRYGFHGTLKAPFRLAAGRTLDQLDHEVATFAARTPAVTIPELTLSRIGRFFALTPGTDAPGLRDLAAAMTTRFDAFRAPATQADIARRRPDTLTPRQREHLMRWGYPYVLDEFRFHLTLTDHVPAELQPQLQETLRTVFAASLGQSIPLSEIGLFIESEPGAPFRLHTLHPLQRRHDPAPSLTHDLKEPHDQ